MQAHADCLEGAHVVVEDSRNLARTSSLSERVAIAYSPLASLVVSPNKTVPWAATAQSTTWPVVGHDPEPLVISD